ncbi:shikimate/quinate 5-dehydrogenase family protein 2 [Cupriavidus basilensis OR16]|uniref:Shikimate/quinate 5-dehydrogenase family protein 2 n=1 Tax=Cupriavidus basilensis OR16 TaxID=1127483 RepID=H1S2I9_9BURK|nr:shikimate/quinate 5-dehydrogenase family protein 2 [Cupriavidus basilensis OR16]
MRTPQLFNASVARQGLNAICVPFHVDSAQLQAFLAGAPAAQNLQGLVVTIPHKENVVAACGELTDTARLVGSVNAMRLDREKGHANAATACPASACCSLAPAAPANRWPTPSPARAPQNWSSTTAPPARPKSSPRA